MNYKFGVYGDSIAFGYGNNNQSWFDLLSCDNEAIKLAKNGETISNILQKIQKDTSNYETLYIAVGVNDLLSTRAVPGQKIFTDLISQYEEIIKVARLRSTNVVVQSLLPVREDLFPNQDWLDKDKWCFNQDIEGFNKLLKGLCDKYQIKYIDAYSEFCHLNLSELYIDAVHLNKKGQDKLLFSILHNL